MLPEAHHYQLLRLIEANPHLSQRELAASIGVSLGKVNYCLKALVRKGFVKMHNFRASDNKLAYAYLLTPWGIETKSRLMVSFLKTKLAEYEAIQREIEELRREIEGNGTT